MGFAPIRHNIPNIVLAPFWCWNSPDLHPCQPRDTKENTIHQTRPPFSIFSMLTCSLLARSVRTGVSMDTLSGLWLCILIHNKLWCTAYSDTFLSEPALTSSAIWRTLAHLLDRTTRPGLYFPRASMSHGRPWRYHWFTTVLSLDHFFFVGLLSALVIEQLKMWQETGWERGGVTRSKGPQAKTQGGAATARTKPLYMGYPLYQLR